MQSGQLTLSGTRWLVLSLALSVFSHHSFALPSAQTDRKAQLEAEVMAEYGTIEEELQAELPRNDSNFQPGLFDHIETPKQIRSRRSLVAQKYMESTDALFYKATAGAFGLNQVCALLKQKAEASMFSQNSLISYEAVTWDYNFTVCYHADWRRNGDWRPDIHTPVQNLFDATCLSNYGAASCLAEKNQSTRRLLSWLIRDDGSKLPFVNWNNEQDQNNLEACQQSFENCISYKNSIQKVVPPAQTSAVESHAAKLPVLVASAPVADFHFTFDQAGAAFAQGVAPTSQELITEWFQTGVVTNPKQVVLGNVKAVEDGYHSDGKFPVAGTSDDFWISKVVFAIVINAFNHKDLIERSQILNSHGSLSTDPSSQIIHISATGASSEIEADKDTMSSRTECRMLATPFMLLCRKTITDPRWNGIDGAKEVVLQYKSFVTAKNLR